MKKFLMGLIIGAGLAFSFSVSAEEVKNFIGSQISGQFPVTVDGEEIENPGIVVDGVSYLPTRVIAELAGFEVYFDADLGIELKKTTNVAEVDQQVGDNTQVPEVNPIVEDLKSIESQIPAARTNITVIEGFLKENPDSEAWKANLQKAKDLLANLESQKAALEAQLETP